VVLTRRIICLGLLFAAVESHAFWPWSASETELNRVPHQILWSAENETRFHFLVNRRNEIHGELAMLERLSEEKRAEQEKIALELDLAFSVEPDKSYRFDRDGSALYILPVRPQHKDTADSDSDLPDEVLHQVLTESQVKDFLTLAQTRQQAQVVIQGLQILKEQKSGQWMDVCDQLEKEFGIERDRNYTYDKSKRIIYRLDSRTTTE